ncbi:MAG: hypothetical protein WB239_16950 [Acidimicrobiia bacterium]
MGACEVGAKWACSRLIFGTGIGRRLAQQSIAGQSAPAHIVGAEEWAAPDIIGPMDEPPMMGEVPELLDQVEIGIASPVGCGSTRGAI